MRMLNTAGFRLVYYRQVTQSTVHGVSRDAFLEPKRRPV